MTTVTGTAAPDISPRQPEPVSTWETGCGEALAPPGHTSIQALWVDTRYVLTGFPIGVLTSTGLTAAVVLGLGTAVLVVGVPILAGTLAVSARIAEAERRRASMVLGRAVPAPERARWWPALAHGLLRIVPSTVSFTVVVTWWFAAAAGLSASLWDWTVPYGPRAEGLPELIGLGSATETRIWLYMAAGLLFALTLAPLVRAMAGMEARFAERLLGGA
ncbi:hypothetical protein J2S43_004344 [Catenuloplanes nepalensis]|uniref:Putative sensor domain-containing protein n=1 Tax=Catenuloplanes nepalensis TaxID=587533 RepID=A0ABT9MWL5_9ACTN|nr:sensor domain-containing protein [Catenuloplanes nepalensis]MDP9795832.1 hypothetical protein [Catenuloplanes nepalensis]